MKKRVVIIGAGISGLSLAWYLQKKFQNRLEIIILEAADRVGGWIESKIVDGAVFECGPRSMRGTFPIIEELGLHSEIIEATATQKYLLYKQRLERMPDSFLSLFSLPLGRECLKAFISYPFRRKAKVVDETVASYFEKRFGRRFVNTFIDPLVAGIYAGLPDELSMRSAFASALRNQKIISFRSGLELLPKTIAAKLHADIRLGCRVESFHEWPDHVSVAYDGGSIQCDHLFSTVARFAPVAVPKASVVTVSLGFKKNLLHYSGFGFLAPSIEEKELLGVVFDSAVFPELNGSYQTRLSVMLGGIRAPHMIDLPEDMLKSKAVAFCAKYLKIDELADFCVATKAIQAISQYPVGHFDRLQDVEVRFKGKKVSFLGMDLYGISIASCISKAQVLAESFQL